MSTSTANATDAARLECAASPRTLDELSRLTSASLAELFARGVVDDDIAALNGHPRGWVLAAPALQAPPLAMLLRRLAASPLILWEGKSFQAAVGAARGRGANRAQVGRRLAVFPYRTSIGPSVVDGRPCIAISYDVPRNPRVLRPIYDELRLVAPGLYLGRGGYRRRRRPARLILWFALDATQQDGALALPIPGD